jgi:hypothetical protein
MNFSVMTKNELIDDAVRGIMYEENAIYEIQKYIEYMREFHTDCDNIYDEIDRHKDLIKKAQSRIAIYRQAISNLTGNK